MVTSGSTMNIYIYSSKVEFKKNPLNYEGLISGFTVIIYLFSSKVDIKKSSVF